MIMKKQLQDVHERIMAVKYPDKRLWDLLEHELLPIIEENEILKYEYDRRILYYERLTKDASYLELIQNIHKEIVALQKLISSPKLPDEPRLFKPKYHNPENEPWITMKDLHAVLDKEETWWRLGKVTIHQVEDCMRTPWRPVIRQYEIFMGLVEHAYKAGAIKREKANSHVETLKNYIEDLEKQLEQPFVRLHIMDFDFLDHYMRNPQWIGSLELVKKYVDRVYKDLILFLEEHEQTMPVKSKGRRKIVKYLGGLKLLYNGEVKIIPKNHQYSNLCEKVYASCQLVGSSIYVLKLYHQLTERDYLVDREKNWNRVFQTVRSANRWAKRNGLPALFRCTKEEVERIV